MVEMKNIIKEIDYGSLSQLNNQREMLYKKFQVFKAMTGIKSEMKKSNKGYDF